MQPPTWKDVGIPTRIVSALREFQPTYAMDCLISQIVFHNTKRLIVTYSCNNCGFAYVPDRSNEEVSQCPQCNSKKVRCFQQLKFTGEKKIPYYTRTGSFILQIVKVMSQNFSVYFKSPPEREVDWEWHMDNRPDYAYGQYHVAFAGGETAQGQYPRIAIARAALLTPYLWDSFFDWKHACRRDANEQKFISHVLTHFMVKKEE